MPHIRLSEGLPGIRGLFAFRPETAKPLCELAKVLLHTPGTLSLAERELIATYVSSQNDCHYCQNAHGAIAACHLEGNENIVFDVKRDFEHANISEKLKSLLAIAGKVQRGGKNVQPEDVKRARRHGATDQEIHDTVLIAAAFCMYNRYVDGLATWAPPDPSSYRERAAKVARDGYLVIPADLQAAQAGRSQP
ncbi:MAG: peroxidase-related enzyme [Acidobacteriia bacterium]|nr:peroxidase-related enzyme [Terriglobia bacterium]